ncbi:hypothetical protein CKA38_02035 [Ereboglobus luteus]|uniref:Amino acid ABC transporter substrate-binding protein n=2 Tax=Ereboglobus luteus TaxID=1796921 RepID=A0A2U8E099_9BACT|nr:hypothetical protein CKA38_02035 [Ereboglobus luteus]
MVFLAKSTLMKTPALSLPAKLTALVSALVLALGLAGCGGGGDSQNTFRIGLEASYPPMEFKDASGKTVGFDIDMAREVAKRLGKDLKIVEIEFDGIWEGLNTERYDAAISACSITQARLKNYLFTKPYIANKQVIVAKKAIADKITSLDALAGMKVGVQKGTTADSACRKFLDENKSKQFTLESYPGATQALDNLELDRLQVVVVDLVVGSYYVNDAKRGFAYAPASFAYEPIGAAFKKTNTELHAKVDKILADMRADGTLQAISKKWFNEDIVSNVKQEYPE